MVVPLPLVSEPHGPVMLQRGHRDYYGIPKDRGGSGGSSSDVDHRVHYGVCPQENVVLCTDVFR